MGDFYELSAALNELLYTDYFDEEYYHKIMRAISKFFGAKNVRIVQDRRCKSLNDMKPTDKTIEARILENVVIEIIEPECIDTNALVYVATFLEGVIKYDEKITDLQTDKLTGLRSNNSLLELINKPSTHHNVGVIFLDVNDLRETNNEKGHEEGDNLLASIANCMHGTIRRKELFRRGGDEFVAICANIPEDVFEEKVQDIKDAIARTPYSAAIGTSYKTVCHDLKTMINEADIRMYVDKAAYKAKKKAANATQYAAAGEDPRAR